MPKPQKSAAARTVPLPGVDLRKQRVEDTLPPGPVLKRVAFRLHGLLSTHLTHGVVTLCEQGLEARIEPDSPIGSKYCQHCRVEASRLRATVK